MACLRAEVARAPYTGATRIYRDSVAPLNVVAAESEFESIAQFEAWWAEYGADPGYAAFRKQWSELCAPGGTNELWTLVE